MAMKGHFLSFHDNKLAILYSNHNKNLTKSKHIKMQFLVVKEKVHNGLVAIEHIGTNYMLANPLTNSLIPKAFHKHTADMAVASIDSTMVMWKLFLRILLCFSMKFMRYLLLQNKDDGCF